MIEEMIEDLNYHHHVQDSQIERLNAFVAELNALCHKYNCRLDAEYIDYDGDSETSIKIEPLPVGAWLGFQAVLDFDYSQDAYKVRVDWHPFRGRR